MKDISATKYGLYFLSFFLSQNIKPKRIPITIKYGICKEPKFSNSNRKKIILPKVGPMNISAIAIIYLI